MQETGDIELLRQYANGGSEEAFVALVSRHVNLVYSVALRRTGNQGAAEEITQAVFIILAKKARSLLRGTVLSGWLYHTARLTAANYLRAEIRRVRREQEAYMQSLSNEPEPSVWPQVAPLLEDAMGRLGEKDLNAVVLRFFENKSLAEVGAALGASEDAAKMRVNRALEKLRKFFAKRGVTLSAAVIAGAVSANSVQAAPIGLAVTISATTVKGSAVAATTLTLVKGALKIMAWTKAKTAAVAVTAVILATGTSTVIVKHMATGPAMVAGPSIDDSFFEANDKKLLGAPANLLILRPTHSTRVSGPLFISGHKGMAPDTTRMSGRCVSLESMLEQAYDFPATKMIFPSNVPKDNFDFLVTVPGNAREKFQAEIKKQLGLAGQREMRDMDVFLLKLRTPGAPGLKLGAGGNSYRAGSYSGRYSAQNAPISAFASYLENSLKQPVIDQTGLKGRYNFTFDERLFKSDQALKQTLLYEFGLELVPRREPIEMLVVEKVP